MWRIYYDDSSSFSDENGAAAAAPPEGVICILQAEPQDGSRQLLHEFDWYWWRPDEGSWYGGCLHGLLDQAMRCGAVAVKQGRSVLNADYQAIISRALRDWSSP